MDFTFSDDQDALRDAVRAFLTDWSRRDVRDARDGLGASTTGDALVELGWTGVLVDRAARRPRPRSRRRGRGARGDGPGRVPGPVPLVGRRRRRSRRGGSALDDLLAALARGEPRHGRARGARPRRPGRPGPHAAPGARARDWMLTGEKPIVLDGPGADWVLVAAAHRRRPRHVPHRRRPTRAGPDDGPDPHGRRASSSTRRRPCPVGPLGDHTAIWRASPTTPRSRSRPSSSACATPRSRWRWSTPKERVQFDQPIASHQVIQHKIVDMLHALELGRVGVHYAAWASDIDDARRGAAPRRSRRSTMAEAAVIVTGGEHPGPRRASASPGTRDAARASTSGRSRTTRCSAYQGRGSGSASPTSSSTRADAVADVDRRVHDACDRRGRASTCTPATRCTSSSGTPAGARPRARGRAPVVGAGPAASRW